MTLLEILVRDLPKRGGWPEGVCHLKQYGSGLVFSSTAPYISKNQFERSVSWPTEMVTREQYEAALAAVEPEWNGDGLPPVGVNCEIIFEDDTPPKWYSFVATFIGSNHIVALVGMEEVTYKKGELLRPGVKFRAICSEATRKRDESIDYIAELCRSSASNGHSAELIYDAIAAGKIPHLKIV